MRKADFSCLDNMQLSLHDGYCVWTLVHDNCGDDDPADYLFSCAVNVHFW